MRWTVLLLAVAATGCSFFLVKGPAQRVDVIGPGYDKCTESPVVPVVDVVGGLALASAAVGGVILEQADDEFEPKNFGKYYAGPLVVGAIVYFVAASRGNNRITWCSDVKERARNGEGPRGQPVQEPAQQVDWEPDPNNPNKEKKKPDKPPPATQQQDTEDPNR